MGFKSDVVIGLEIHAELNTETKLFCSCPRGKSDEPNTRTCPVCLGHPGSKPVVNKKAIEYAIKLCLALGCRISPEIVFSRKSYFYPDMAKNFQISQYEVPLGQGGKLKLKNGAEIGIVRVHLEEDPASLVHPKGMKESAYVLVDYNRSGNPLVEIVTRPELESPEDARDFMKQLITVLTYLEIFDENSGIIKADANVSVKESGYVRAEVKNITGFKEIERALFYEVERQKKELSEGKRIVQETRAWDSQRGVTFTLRTKEAEEDYGYIVEPDLTKIEISRGWVSKLEEEMPELAQDKAAKFVSKHKIKKADAEVLAAEKELAELFEKVAEKINPMLAAKWLRRELARVLNYNKKTLKDIEVDEKQIIALLSLIEKKEITETTGQKLMERLIERPFDIRQVVKREKLSIVSDAAQLEKYCKEAVKENQKAVEEYKAGKEKAIHFIVGKVMAKTRGKADPKEVNKIIKRLIG
jgi:aspartyl-tRNA(Asn)/glutamyl-tRNA(Gln) amidotransferase subunit B